MNIRSIAATLLLVTVAGAAQAASLAPAVGSLALAPATKTVPQGSAFTLDLVLDATGAPGTNPGGLFGGEIVVNFDTALLSYGGFTLASGLSYFAAPSVSTSGTTQTVHFGFDNAPRTGTVGTFSFTALGAPGTLALIGLADGDDFAGSFASYLPTYQRFYPNFSGAQIATVVPLPAGLWLLGTAIGALALAQRRRVSAAP